jgi:hypothetical protein
VKEKQGEDSCCRGEHKGTRSQQQRLTSVIGRELVLSVSMVVSYNHGEGGTKDQVGTRIPLGG